MLFGFFGMSFIYAWNSTRIDSSAATGTFWEVEPSTLVSDTHLEVR